MPKLTKYVSEIVPQWLHELDNDQRRWGDTWLKRPIEGQDARAAARLKDYISQFENAGTPLPRFKIMGEMLILLVRDQHPELFPDDAGVQNG